MENEKERDIHIDQRFHRTIIGTKGDKIREIRDKFNQVQISFPDPGECGGWGGGGQVLWVGMCGCVNVRVSSVLCSGSS